MLLCWFLFNLFLRYAFLSSRGPLADLVTVLSVQKVRFLTVKRAQRLKQSPAPAAQTLTPVQKQARVNKLLKNFVDGGINILNAEKMLKVYEQQNVLWRIENAEFSHLVKIYGSSLSYTTQASLFLLWRKNEFQNLIQKYVS